MNTNEIQIALAETETDIDRIYAWLGEDDLTDAEEADAYRDLKLVAQRRDALRLMLSK